MLEKVLNGDANGSMNGFANGHAGQPETEPPVTAPILEQATSMAEKVNTEKPLNLNGSIHRMRQMPPAAKLKKKDEGAVRQMCAWIVEHQIGMTTLNTRETFYFAESNVQKDYHSTFWHWSI